MKTLIKEKRTSLNMTQEELAKRLDVSRQTVISLERESINLHSFWRINWLKFLNV